MMPVKNQATAMCNMHRKFCEAWIVIIETNRQTQTCSSQHSTSIPGWSIKHVL